MRALSAQPTGGEPEEIIVTGTIFDVPRRQLATAVSVIGGDEIELRGYNTLPDIMRTQPAIGVSNSGGVGKTTTLRIRGEEGYRTLLMIDGVKALDPSAPQVAPSFDGLLTTGDLDRVEVLRGPQGFIYGADAGGVVNILTRRGEGHIGGRIGLERGQYGTQKTDASISGGGAAGDYFVSVTDLETDGFNARVSDSQLRDDDGAQNTTVHARLGWHAAQNLRIQFVAHDIDASAMLDGCGFPVVDDCVTMTRQSTYKLSADHDTNNFSNRVGFSSVDIEREDLAEGIGSFRTSGSIRRFEYTGSYRPGNAMTVIYGIDARSERMDSNGTRDERDQDAYFFEVQGELNERLFISAGARRDDNEDFGSATSARLSAAWLHDLDSRGTVKYRASYGTGFRPPSMFEIAYNAGPFALAPAAGFALVEETSAGYDLGIDYDTAAGLHLEFTWFSQNIDDAIEFDLRGFSGYLQKPGKSTSDGFEIAARIPAGDRIEVLANWTGNDAKDSTGNPRARRPKVLANLGVSYESMSEALHFIANYRVSRDAVDEVFGVGFVPLDDYAVLDLSASYRLGRNFEIYGRIENALDETYTEISGYNSAGRSTYAGVRLRF